MFSEVASSGKCELVVRKDALSEAAARAIEDGSDASLFAVSSLNHLQLCGFSRLPSLARVGGLPGLLQLSLTENQLQSLPEEVGSLQRLRLLDVSRNSLTSLPASLLLLPALQTLILAHNSLTDDSFPAAPAAGKLAVLPSLHQLDVAGNQLSSLPAFLSLTPHLAELRASHNALSSLDAAIVGKMAGLRLLEAHNNQLPSVPHELAHCSKLKALQLEGNPLNDRRLLKLVAQHGAHKPKAVLEYIASRGPQPSASSREPGKKKKGKGKGRVVVKEEGSEDSDVEFSDRPPLLTIVRPEKGAGLEVVATGDARRVRPYLVCTVLRGLELGNQEVFREFITLQVSGDSGDTGDMVRGVEGV